MQLLKILNLFTLILISILLVGCEDLNVVRVSLQRSIASNEPGANNAPSLSAIANQSLKAGSAISTINAGDNGTDHDVDGDVLTYSCFYDTSVDGAVAEVSTCAGISGATFNTTTGVFNWTTGLSDVGLYEFKIIATDGTLLDSKIFTIAVSANVAPVLDAIADQTTSEGIAITTINAGEAGADVDSEGETLTYTCHYDTTVDGSVGTTNLCSALSGASFNTTTGVFNWLPNLTQAGSYEFKITATDGIDSSEQIFEITVNNTNQAPLLDTISNQTVNENVAISTINAGDSGDDYDRDGDLITYACYYDTTVDGAVATTNSCLSLTGVSFDVGTGVMDWTPTYSQSGIYEFRIEGSDGSLTGDEIFTITVNNVNRAPVLDAISNQTVDELTAITSINAGDGGDDYDIDNEAITYSCFYDLSVDGAVASTTACTSLTGLSFNTSTGVMNWTPSLTQSGNYEFKIIGSDGALTDSKIFTITVNNITPFIFKWKTTTSSEVLGLPMVNAGTYNFKVDWGDGSVSTGMTSFSDARRYHTYAAAGTYTVMIVGVMSHISFQSESSKTKVIEVVDLGNTQAVNLGYAFSGCTNLVSFAGGDTSKVTDMTALFSGATSLVNVDLSTFDTSKVTGVPSMFNGATSIVSLDVSSFDTSNMTNMTYMFAGMTSLTSLDLSNFNTSKVTRMYSMFGNSSNLATLNLSSFQTSLVEDMSSMFTGLSKLTALDLSSFDTRKVTTMSGMFYGCSSLTSLNISSFRTPLVTDMSSMFNGVSKLTSLDVTHFDTSNVTTMASMFAFMNELTGLDLSSFNTSKVTSMASMFRSLYKMPSINLSGFDTSKVTTMESMFNSSLMTTLDLSNFNTSLVTRMNSMFAYMTSLTSLNVSSFNTSNVTLMNNMFQRLAILSSLNLSNFDTTKVTNMMSMFDSSTGLTSLDLSNFVTPAVTNMSYMFNTCNKLTTLNISNFNTSNVTNMSAMFGNASKLASLDLSNFNTSKVTDMGYMFNGVELITTLDLSNFDTSSVTTMASMFAGMSNLTNLDISSFNTSNVIYMSSMFSQARKVVFDFSNFNTSKVTTMAQMFMGTNATSLDLTAFDTSKVTNMQSMFFAANNLTSLDATGWNVTGVTNSTNVFSGVPVGFKVTCDQGGAPATGALFGQACY